jgi:hypothetical protein
VQERAATALQFVHLGADHLIFMLGTPPEVAEVQQVWYELLPRIRDSAGR